MLCCKCKKNLAVVYVSRIDENGKSVNEGYCLTCAKELNLGLVNDIMEKMGINPEEMDGLNREMSAMMEEMGDEFSSESGMGIAPEGFSDSDDTEDDADSNAKQAEEKSKPKNRKRKSFLIPMP